MKLDKFPIKKLYPHQKAYPPALKKLKKPPAPLFVRGRLSHRLLKKSLAVVGTRRLTPYGRNIIKLLIPPLVKQKVTIVSGFMYGVDSLAHQTCLDHGGQTIAVLGNGLNVIYPPENQKLYLQILKTGGCILSEYPPDFKARLWTFPQRNRLIVALSSLGVLVIEAGQKSGALITAHLALKQKKELFAVPGPITSPVSYGTNLLLKTGRAQLVTSANDILGKKSASSSSATSLSSLEKKILDLLGAQPLTADQLAKLLNQPITTLNQTLSLMSLKGLISDTAGQYFPQTI